MWTKHAMLNRKFHISQISYCEELVPIGTNSSQRVKNWYQYVTYFIPIFHILWNLRTYWNYM